MKIAMLAGALAAGLLLTGCAHVQTPTAASAAADMASKSAPPAIKPVAYQSGKASWYAMGHTTASGERYNPDGLSAAHPSLPFGTEVEVTNVDNGKSVTVIINDRGPFVGGRVIDMSRGAARKLDMIRSGTAKVNISILQPVDGAETPSAILAYR